MNEKQISNEMADRLLESTFSYLDDNEREKIKTLWQKDNLIEESALEKARRRRSELSDYLHKIEESGAANKLHCIYHAYEQELASKEARIKELEEGKK